MPVVAVSHRMIDTFATGLIHLEFLNGHRAQALSLSDRQTVAQALEKMGMTSPQPTLVIIGGASLMSAESLNRLQRVFNQVLAPLAQELNLTVLDGGTDAGVIHLMGQARHQVGGNFPLIGVVPQGKAKLPNGAGPPVADEGRYDLEPHHTQFFLIPGQEWGSESPWLAELATQIASHQPALTILINGGKISFTDLQVNLAEGRPMLVLAGSGRLADEVTAALSDSGAEVNPQLMELIQHYQPSGRLAMLDFAMPMEAMRDRIRQYYVPPL
jgi:hypothetical protein